MEKKVNEMKEERQQEQSAFRLIIDYSIYF